jgi:hypothetical protein
MREKVAAQAQPWLDGWNALTSNGRSQLGGTPRQLATVVRGGDDSNFAQLLHRRCPHLPAGTRWKVSGDTPTPIGP